jgi:hypothetical protein
LEKGCWRCVWSFGDWCIGVNTGELDDVGRRSRIRRKRSRIVGWPTKVIDSNSIGIRTVQRDVWRSWEHQLWILVRPNDRCYIQIQAHTWRKAGEAFVVRVDHISLKKLHVGRWIPDQI